MLLAIPSFQALLSVQKSREFDSWEQVLWMGTVTMSPRSGLPETWFFFLSTFWLPCYKFSGSRCSDLLFLPFPGIPPSSDLLHNNKAGIAPGEWLTKVTFRFGAKMMKALFWHSVQAASYKTQIPLENLAFCVAAGEEWWLHACLGINITEAFA